MPHERSLPEILLESVAEDSNDEDFSLRAVQLICDYFAADSVGLYVAADGTWQTLAKTGDGAEPQQEALAEAADRNARHVDAGWTIVPLRGRSRSVTLLAAHTSEGLPDDQVSSCQTALAHVLRISDRQAQAQVAVRINAMLRTLPGERFAALRHIELNVARILGVECVIVGFLEKTSHEVDRPHADDGQTDRLALPKSALPGKRQHQLLVEQNDDGDLDRISKQLGIAMRSMYVQVVRTDDAGAKTVLLVANPASGSSCEDRLEQLVSALATVEYLNAPIMRSKTGSPLIGSSPQMQRLSDQIDRVAATDLVVLVLGENGTGKELVSRTIHERSDRAQEPFLAVNCAALTETLLESELFGHEKGAFTDAHESKPGKFEQATGGTLFLDEVGELSLAGQAKLLRTLETQLVVRVGGSQSIKTDARVIAATNRDLATMVREGAFREDLFYRINVVMLRIPALRDRGADIIEIAESLLAEFAPKVGRKHRQQLSGSANQALRAWPWPGNVRELRNLMERLAYMSSSDIIDGELVQAELALGSNSPSITSTTLADATKEFQIHHITEMIKAKGGSMTEAAKALGLHRSNMYRKMRQLGMNVRED